MKDLSRQKFEETWKQAFDGAQVEPSASVWANIELDLTRAESSSMKRQVLFYKWLAAASVFLMMFLAGTFYFGSNTGDKRLATASSESTHNSDVKKDNGSNETIKDKNTTSAGDNTTTSKPALPDKKETDKRLTSNQSHAPLYPNTDEKSDVVFKAQNELINTGNNVSKRKYAAVTFESIVEDVPAVVHGKIELPRLVLPAMPASFMASSKKDQSKEDLWASVGVSAGSYNPDYSGSRASYSPGPNSSAQSSYQSSSGYSDASNVGSAYSAGFAMSKRVFSRWVLQSGVNYINQSIGYTSNYLTTSPSNQSKAFVAEYADFMNQSVTITTPYQINSVVEVLSLPLQTGYLLVDRKIGWQLNTGVATDIFIRNTLTDQSGNANRFSQGAGESSPYRTVSWSGLLGTELSYKVATQYRFSVVPSMRYSVNSVMKSTSRVSNNPLVMDIGFRFRYIFK